MKFFKNFFLIIVIFLLTLSILKAEDKVAYLDIDFILTNTLAGKSLLNNLKNQENIKINEFKSKDEKFRNDEKKIIAKKNLDSNELIEKDLKELQIKFQEYRKSKNQDIENLKKKRNKNIINFINLINPIIEKYMKDNSIYMLLIKKMFLLLIITTI